MVIILPELTNVATVPVAEPIWLGYCTVTCVLGAWLATVPE